MQAARNRGDNLSERFVSTVLEKVAELFAVEAVPSLDKRQVLARVAKLSKSTQPLRRTLAELRFYQESDLLTDDEAATAYGHSLDRSDGKNLGDRKQPPNGRKWSDSG